MSIAPRLRGARRDVTGEGDAPADPGEGLARGAGRTLGVVGLALVLLSAMDSIRNLPEQRHVRLGVRLLLRASRS